MVQHKVVNTAVSDVVLVMKKINGWEHFRLTFHAYHKQKANSEKLIYPCETPLTRLTCQIPCEATLLALFLILAVSHSRLN